MLYLTNTGRRWDGERVSVRDKVNEESGNRDYIKFRDLGILPVTEIEKRN